MIGYHLLSLNWTHYTLFVSLIEIASTKEMMQPCVIYLYIISLVS